MNLDTPYEILLVEDDENDRILIRHAFESGARQVRLSMVTTGPEAQAYLAGKDDFANRDQYPFPSMVLLDLRLPVHSGLEVLGWIRAQPSLRQIPVIVLTSSLEARNVQKAYALGANSFILKKADQKELVRMATGLQTYAELLASGRPSP
jgi:CheY-like chemotaxis protein